MRLKSTVKVKSKYSDKTKFDFWKMIDVGDTIVVSLPLVNPGRGREAYAPQILIKNERTSEKFRCSLVQAVNYFEKLEVEQVEDSRTNPE